MNPQMMNLGMSMPQPQVGLVGTGGGSGLPTNFSAPGMVGPNNTGGIFGALAPGKFNFTEMLQQLQQQQGQGQQAPTHAPLMMPQMNAPQFQMSPLSGLFGLHRGV